MLLNETQTQQVLDQLTVVSSDQEIKDLVLKTYSEARLLFPIPKPIHTSELSEAISNLSLLRDQKFNIQRCDLFNFN